MLYRVVNTREQCLFTQAAELLSSHLLSASHLVCLQAYRATSDSLHSRLQLLEKFRTAQQAWDRQLDVLHATPADSPDCRQRLEEMEAAGQALLLAAEALQVRALLVQGAMTATSVYFRGLQGLCGLAASAINVPADSAISP